MPSARIHDTITLILVPPTFLVAFSITGSVDLSVVTTGAMLFAGFMFGPDLDIESKQYARWGPFRFIWWPYQFIFRHRSRLSHGIILGTAIRVLYFAIMLILLAGILLFLNQWLDPHIRAHPDLAELSKRIWKVWQAIDRRYLVAAFFGLWWGAASHTLTDWIHEVWTRTKRIF
ncbi:MAG: metal-binding protein [Acidobacteria bacterium]|nr:MAG: metal-binding protein [Acidobacteriota bacterium]